MSSYVCFLLSIKCLLVYENYIYQLARKLVFGHWMILPNLQDSNKIKHKLLSQPIQTNVCMDEPFSCNGGSNKEGPIEMCVYGV